MRRRVGITSWPRAVPVGGAVAEPNDTVPRAYVRAVTKAGGLPVLLPMIDPADAGELLAAVDALVFVGGGDVDPARYGQAPAPETADVDADRDAFDIALWEAVLQRGTPTLGTCRAVQILNVALGGSLHQHIEGHTGNVTHAVTYLDSGRTVDVNSLHHQALDRLGDGVHVAATAADGTVEAFTVAGAPHITAVQWHPELLRHAPEHLALFERLLEPENQKR